MKTYQIAIAIVVIFALGFSIGRFIVPAKVIEKEKEVKNDIVKQGTKKTITTKPDGTRVESEQTIFVTDKSEIKEKYIEKKIQWDYGIGVFTDYNRLKEKDFSFYVERRIIGGLSLTLGTDNHFSSLQFGVSAKF